MATERFPLPNGQWADLRDADDIPERLRRPARLAGLRMRRTLPEPVKPQVTVEELPDGSEDVASEETKAAFGAPPVEELVEAAKESDEAEDEALRNASDETAMAADAYNDTLFVCFVVSWSFEFPVTEASVQELPGGAFDALLAEIRRRNDEDDEKDEAGPDSAADSPDAAGSDPTSP